MIIENVLWFKNGCTVITLASVYTDYNPWGSSYPGCVEWPRMLACAKQLIEELPKLNGLTLQGVQRFRRPGDLVSVEQQFTFTESDDADRTTGMEKVYKWLNTKEYVKSVDRKVCLQPLDDHSCYGLCRCISLLYDDGDIAHTIAQDMYDRITESPNTAYVTVE